jgi:hypothetical protein
VSAKVTWLEASLEVMHNARERGDLDERTVLALAKHLDQLHQGHTLSRMDRLRAALKVTS